MYNDVKLQPIDQQKTSLRVLRVLCERLYYRTIEYTPLPGLQSLMANKQLQVAYQDKGNSRVLFTRQWS